MRRAERYAGGYARTNHIDYFVASYDVATAHRLMRCCEPQENINNHPLPEAR